MSESTLPFGAPTTTAPVGQPEAPSPGPQSGRSRRTVLLAALALGGLLVVAGAAYELLGSSSGSAVPSGAVPTPPLAAGVHPKPSASSVAVPAAALNTITGRDPFSPAVVLPSAAPAAPGPAASASASASAHPSASASASASSSASPGGGTAAIPSTGTAAQFALQSLTPVKSAEGGVVANSKVNGVVYSAGLGQVFGKYFQFIGVTGPTCGVFLYGDVTINACVGQTLLLAG